MLSNSNLNNSNIENVLTVGPIVDKLNCKHIKKYIKIGCVFSQETMFNQLFDANNTLKINTIIALANEYNGHGIWVEIQEISFGFFVTIKDTNNATILNKKLLPNAKKAYLHLIFNRFNNTLDLVVSDNIKYNADKSGLYAMSTDELLNHKYPTWKNTDGLYKHWASYDLYNITSKHKYVFVIETNNHDLENECKNGWPISVRMNSNNVKYSNIIHKQAKTKDFKCTIGSMDSLYKNEFFCKNVNWGNL